MYTYKTKANDMLSDSGFFFLLLLFYTMLPMSKCIFENDYYKHLKSFKWYWSGLNISIPDERISLYNMNDWNGDVVNFCFVKNILPYNFITNNMLLYAILFKNWKYI